MRRFAFSATLAVALAVVLAFLTLPVLAIFVNTGPRELIASLSEQQSVDALRLSLETTLIAIVLIVLFGTPTAYLLATRSFRGRSVLVMLVELPLVLPPAVAGIALLVAFGPEGLLGGVLDAAGVTLVLQTAGVVVALVFVSAPFYIRQTQAAIEALATNAVDAARTLGASEAGAFRRVVIPSARPGIAAGLALAWGRALGEFGATLMFAGSIQGVTQTVPLAIYGQFAVDLPAALALSAVLVACSAGLLLAVKLMAGWGGTSARA